LTRICKFAYDEAVDLVWSVAFRRFGLQRMSALAFTPRLSAAALNADAACLASRSGIDPSDFKTQSSAALRSRLRFFFLRIAALDCCGVPCPTNRDSYRLSMLNLCDLSIHGDESPVTFGTAYQQASGIGEFPARKVYER
jgi:hypothetical protein